MTVTTGRDGTVKPSSKWNRGPVLSRPVDHFTYTINSYCPVPPRKVLPLHFTVPSRRGNIPLPSRPVDKTCPTVLSRLQNLPLPSRLVGKTCPYRPVPPSKPVPTVKSRGHNLSLPSRPAIHCHQSFPSRCRDRQDAVNTMNNYLKSICIFFCNMALFSEPRPFGSVFV